MNVWQTVALVAVIAFFGTHVGAWAYWASRGKSRGAPRPTWRKALGEAWTAGLGAVVALMIFGK